MNESDRGDSHGHGPVVPCRVLVVGEAIDAGAARERLGAPTYEALCAPADNSLPAAREFQPNLVLFAFGAREQERGLVAAARRFRNTSEMFSIPIVFLFRNDERTLRSAALNLGVDDYLPLSASETELFARLESLFWRTEAGRRAAPLVIDEHSKIDNFFFLLEAIGRDANEGAHGTVAVVSLVPTSSDSGEKLQSALVMAHGLLKLNLRRIDGVAFYGPENLLVYLPRYDSATAARVLNELRSVFRGSQSGFDLAAGIITFRNADEKIEALVEKAEAALKEARGRDAMARIVEYGANSEIPNQPQADSPVSVPVPSGRDPRTAKTALVSEVTRAEPSAGSGAASQAPVAQEISRRLLLVVSDVARMAQINLLLQSAGYEVRAAFDGEQALQLLRIENSHVVIIDFALSDIDGISLLERYRKQVGGQSGSIFLLLVPSEKKTALAEEALRVGVKRTIDLPYDPVELLNFVHAASVESQSN